MVLLGSSHSHPLDGSTTNVPLNVPLVERFNIAEEFML